MWEHDAVSTTLFEIHRGVKYRGKISFAPLDTVEGMNSDAYPNLEAGSYLYKVRAQSSSGPTDFTNEVQVIIESTTFTEPVPGVEAPTLSATVDQSNSTVLLSWTDICGTTPNCGYEIQRGTTKNKGVVNFQFLYEGTGLSFPVREDPGTYYYRVLPKIDGELGPQSNTVSVRVR